MKINRKKAMEIIGGTHGKIFGVEFIKKDGAVRIMAARKGVYKHLKGGSMPYNPKNYGLIPVFDMNSSYRTVNINTLKKIKFQKKTYEVV